MYMYVCMYVYIYTYIHIYTYMYIYVYAGTSLSAFGRLERSGSHASAAHARTLPPFRQIIYLTECIHQLILEGQPPYQNVNLIM